MANSSHVNLKMTFKASNVVPRLPADPVIDSSPELFVTLTSGGCQFFFFFLHSVMFGFLFLWGRNEQPSSGCQRCREPGAAAAADSSQASCGGGFL